MWPDLTRRLTRYPSAVLTGLDAAGYPYSLRCVPEPDAVQKALRVRLPDYAPVQAGPAGLLCHYHDDELWNQTNFVVRGTLERDGEAWLFRPARLIEGAGAGMNPLRQIRDGRRAAGRYLAQRGLARPRIPWERLHAIAERARAKGEKR